MRQKAKKGDNGDNPMVRSIAEKDHLLGNLVPLTCWVLLCIASKRSLLRRSRPVPSHLRFSPNPELPHLKVIIHYAAIIR